MTGSTDPSASPDAQLRTVLAHLGVAMIATGAPVSDIEDELIELGGHLGRPDLQIGAAPTGLTLALGSGEPATYQAVRGGLRLDQAAEVRTIRYRLLDGSLTVAAATDQLTLLSARPPRYPGWLGNLGWLVISAGIALILQPGGANVGFAVLSAGLVLGLYRLGQHVQLVATLLPTLAACVAGCLVFAAADAGWLQGPLRTLLPALAILLPGALIVTAMSELAAGDMVAGAARLIFGAVQLLLFTVGVVAAARLVGISAADLGNVRVHELGWWAAPLGLVSISVGVVLLEGPPLRLLPWITGVLVLAFVAQTLGQSLASPPVGSFLGALAASLGSYLVEALRPLPRLVVFQPAFWLLVPGSLGLLTTTAVVFDPGSAVTTAVGVFGVVTAIALGLLVGTAVAQSVRGAVRRTRRFRAQGWHLHPRR